MKESLVRDIREILRIYEEARSRDDYPLSIPSTIWVTTPISVLLREVDIINDWFKAENNTHQGNALVPRPGDGRRAACLARLGYDVLAIENIPELVAYGTELTDHLAERGLIERGKIRFLQGYHLDDRLYTLNGTTFEQMEKIFARLDKRELSLLIRKVEAKSPSGAQLVVLHPEDILIPKNDLEHITTNVIIDSDIRIVYKLSRYMKA